MAAEQTNYAEMTLDQLRPLAAERGLNPADYRVKDDLVAALAQQDADAAAAQEDQQAQDRAAGTATEDSGQYITVVGVQQPNTTGKRVALWDVSAAHPDGEVFISTNGKEHKVAPTAAVYGAIRDGRLREVK
jgi:hypothetical protein